MAQVLDQRVRLYENFAVLSLNDPSLAGTHISSVQCIVISGTTPKTALEKRSFDIFKHSSKDVTVVTFDELLDKLRELLRLISTQTDDAAMDATQSK